MENNHNKNQPEKEFEDKPGKTGVVPNKDLEGSDADKAYSKDGEFNQSSKDKKDDHQTGADADVDEE